MDYCHPCRRHLNGALACPGCGTPVEEPRAAEPHLTEAEEAPPSRVEEVRAADGRPSGGRGSRRDRKAAAHRRRRRRVLFVTAGFVLAAGGLSLAELGLDAPGSPPRPAAAGGESTDGEATREVGETSAVPADATSGTVTATTASGTPSPDASASGSASALASKSPSATEPETAEETDGPSQPPASAPDAPGTPDRPTAPPDDPPPTTTPTPSTSPDPTPTETCDRFLWWCT
ncbi:SCO2400 family protein [Streptomyces mutabilis]|uniref:SCO2400 family protein n=1 Tax=Streptomyces mutabilis TaxID=67332 RepID=UPI0039889522